MSAKFRPICLKFSLIALFLLLFQVSYSQERFAAAVVITDQQAKLLKQEVVLVVATKDTTVFKKT